MSGIKVTTDMGDWSTLPLRMRLAIIVLVIQAMPSGVGFAVGLLSLEAAFILEAGLLIACSLVFDRRRSWWPDEPTLPIDPIGRNLRRKMVLFVALIVAAVVLGSAGILPT